MAPIKCKGCLGSRFVQRINMKLSFNTTFRHAVVCPRCLGEGVVDPLKYIPIYDTKPKSYFWTDPDPAWWVKD